MSIARDIKVEEMDDGSLVPQKGLRLVGKEDSANTYAQHISKDGKKIYLVTWSGWPSPPKFRIEGMLLEAREKIGFVIGVGVVAPIFGTFERLPVSQKRGVVRYGIKVTSIPR